jgi:hypothetical protein
MLEELIGVTEVGLDHGGARYPGEDLVAVGDDALVVVGVQHPGAGLDLARHLVRAALCGQPGTEVHELADTALSHPPHRALEEAAVRPGSIADLGDQHP